MASGNCYDAFRAQLHDTGMPLPALLDAPRPKIPGEVHFRANGWFGAIAVAGELLRINPDTSLVPNILTEDVLMQPPDTTERTLLAMLNASVEPVQPTQDSWAVNGRAAPRIDTCGTAEYLFNASLDAMQPDAPTDLAEVIGGWEYVTDQDEVIGFRKHEGERALLSFVPVNINGIPYPKGSIFSATTNRFVKPEAGAGTKLPVDEIGRLLFMRLSFYGLVRAEQQRLLSDFRQQTGTEAPHFLNHLYDLDTVREITQTAYERYKGTQAD